MTPFGLDTPRPLIALDSKDHRESTPRVALDTFRSPNDDAPLIDEHFRIELRNLPAQRSLDENGDLSDLNSPGP